MLPRFWSAGSSHHHLTHISQNYFLGNRRITSVVESPVTFNFVVSPIKDICISVSLSKVSLVGLYGVVEQTSEPRQRGMTLVQTDRNNSNRCQVIIAATITQ